MIDVNNENLIQFCHLPAHIEKVTGKRPALSTLHRWRLKGRQGVALETVKIGGERYSSLEALDRFIHRLTAASDGEQVATLPSPGKAKTKSYLKKEGLIKA